MQQTHVFSGEIGRRMRSATISAELRRGVVAGVLADTFDGDRAGFDICP